MKIEILTIHRLNNFGSAFQAMALCEYLNNTGLMNIMGDEEFYKQDTFDIINRRIAQSQKYIEQVFVERNE